MTTEEQGQRARIRMMRAAGASIFNIAKAVGLWPESVRRIVSLVESEEAKQKGRRDLQAQIVLVDDPDEPWPVDDLLDALELRSIVRTAVAPHFDRLETGNASLREIMDLTISDQAHPKPGYLVAPFLAFRCGGILGFWNLVARLTESDLGEKTNRLWRRKLSKVSACSRIVGPTSHSWSKPCQPPPEIEAALNRHAVDV
jgi:hypothetical protein